jgi:nitrilase
MAESVRIAAVQDSPALLDRDACITQVEELTTEAADQGAALVVFPEAFVPGPPVWIDAVLPGEDDEWHVLLHRNAITVPSRDVDRLGAAARDSGVVLVVGVNERDPNGGTIYNTVLTFGPDGALLGRHRKLVPTHAERLVWGMGDGSDLVVLDSPAGRLASLICWENYMPLARFHLYSQGPDIWLAPTLATHEPWVASMRHIAREASCHVLGVAPAMHVGWLPDGLPDTAPLAKFAEAHDGWLLEGYSVIVDPAGTVLAGPLVRERGIIVADIDHDAAHARKRLLDVVGHYNRPDVFRLEVDDRGKPGVVTLRGSQVVHGEPVLGLEPLGDQRAVAGLGVALHAEERGDAV